MELNTLALAEVSRLEDALLRFTQGRQWEIQTVTFPSTANTDLDIAHSLSSPDPELVDVQVLGMSIPGMVYRDGSSTRTGWSDGLLRLRCTSASAQVTLLLSVAAEDTSRTFPVGDVSPVRIPTLGGTTSTYLGVGKVGSSTWSEGYIGPGVDFDGTWMLGLNDQGSDIRLQVTDDATGYTPFMVRKLSGTYYVQPGYTSRGLGMVANLGNDVDSFSKGYWDNGYINSIYCTNIYQGGSATSIGAFQTPTYSSSNFTSQTGTWTVAAGSIQTYRYAVVGKTMTLLFGFFNTSVSNVSSYLSFRIPGSYTAGSTTYNLVRVSDNGAAVVAGLAEVVSGTNVVNVYSNPNGGVWNIAAGTTLIQGQITLEVA